MTPLPQREKMAMLAVLRESSQNDCVTEPAWIDQRVPHRASSASFAILLHGRASSIDFSMQLMSFFWFFVVKLKISSNVVVQIRASQGSCVR